MTRYTVSIRNKAGDERECEVCEGFTAAVFAAAEQNRATGLPVAYDMPDDPNAEGEYIIIERAEA